MNFALTLKELRKEAQITQMELSKKIGFANSIISDWENGISEPGLKAIVALATFFNVSTDFLLGFEDFGGTKSLPLAPSPLSRYAEFEKLLDQMSTESKENIFATCRAFAARDIANARTTKNISNK